MVPVLSYRTNQRLGVHLGGVVVGLDLLLCLLGGVVLGLLGVDEVKALGLDDVVDESAGESSEEFLCLLVRLGLAVLLDVLLVGLGGLVGGGGGEERVGDATLVAALDLMCDVISHRVSV